MRKTNISNILSSTASIHWCSCWHMLRIKDEIKVREDKPPLVNQQCMVYSFQCGLCDDGSRMKISCLFWVNNAWCIHFSLACAMLTMLAAHADTYTKELKNTKDQQLENHLRELQDMEPEEIAQSFWILRKCQNKFECLIFEMFFYQRTETNAKQTVRFNLYQTIWDHVYLRHLLTECRSILSADMGTDTQPIYWLTLGRYVGQDSVACQSTWTDKHVGRHPADTSPPLDWYRSIDCFFPSIGHSGICSCESLLFLLSACREVALHMYSKWWQFELHPRTINTRT